LRDGFNKASLGRRFVGKKEDGAARFLIYDYGPGDTLTVPSVLSTTTVAP
jgi:hypothetical protein